MERILTISLIWILFSAHSAFSSDDEDTDDAAMETAPIASKQTQIPNLTLRVGQRYPMEGFQARSARVVPDRVASVRVVDRNVLLTGVAAGQATLFLDMEDGHPLQIPLTVVQNKEGGRDSLNAAFADLKKMPGLNLKQLGEKTLVQGEALGRDNYKRLLLHIRNFPQSLLVLASPAPGLKASLIEQAQSLLSSRGFNGVKIANAGNRFFLEGNVSDPDGIDQAIELAQSVIPNVENHLPVPIRIDPVISMRIFLLELSREAHEQLGLSWPQFAPGAAVYSPKGGGIFNPEWSATLRHLSTSGQAKVLAEPILAVKNGSDAELSAGGEIPIKLTGRFENKVVWKNYGLKIKLSIAGIAGQQIRTKISTESSQLDEATMVEGIPGIRSNKMATEVDVPEGRPVLLTGLFQSSMSKDVEKVPVLGSIPILGELFKSRNFKNRDSELLVAILPRFGLEDAKTPLESAHGLDFDRKWRISD